MKKEIIVSVLLVIFVSLLLNPTICAIPIMEASVIVLIFLFLTLVIGILWKERPKDERELFHMQLASRLAYVAGMALLTAGIIFQTIKGRLDGWLIIVLSGMVAGKLLGLLYSQKKH